MAGIGDLTGKAQQFLKNEKVQEALHGKQAEQVSDSILDAAAKAADAASGGKHTDAIRNARDKADKSVGDR